MEDLTDLYGVLFYCPVGIRSMDCPFCKVGKLPFYYRVMWLDSLTDEEKSKLYKHHIECSNKRDIRHKR